MRVHLIGSEGWFSAACDTIEINGIALAENKSFYVAS